jgi:hypothetical protein
MFVGELLHDRIIGALELCCRRGEMLLIQNQRVNWDTHQIGIPGATAKDKENRRIPFNPKGRLAAVLTHRATLGPDAYVFGGTHGTYQPTIQTAWETLKLLANGLEPKTGEEGVKWNADQLRRIDLRWHDLRHEGACRLLADGVDIRIIQLMLGHASIQQTQRYLNVTDEELRKGLEVSWGRQLRAVSGQSTSRLVRQSVPKTSPRDRKFEGIWLAALDDFRNWLLCAAPVGLLCQRAGSVVGVKPHRDTRVLNRRSDRKRSHLESTGRKIRWTSCAS